VTDPDTAVAAAGTRPRRPVRRLWLGAVLAIVAWLILGGVGASYQPRLSDVQQNDTAAFLPDGVESTRVNELAADFVLSDTFPAFVVVEADRVLTPAQLADVQAFAEEIPGLPVVVGVADDEADRPSDDPADTTIADYLGETPPGAPPVVVVPSQDGQAALLFVQFDVTAFETPLADGSDAITKSVVAIREADADITTGVTTYVAGPAASIADFGEAFAGIDGVLLGVALLAVFIILLVVYRSPVLPFIVILASVFALAASSIFVYLLADSGAIDLNGQSQGILFILVVGATTDYSLLLTARYREELRLHDSRFEAMRSAWRRAFEPIVASGFTVILGLLCLLLSQLGSNRALGPVAGVGLVMAMASALTFLPALLLLPAFVMGLLLIGVPTAVGAAIAGFALGGSAATATGAGLGAVVGILATVLIGRRMARRQHSRADHGDAVEAGRWVFWPGVPHVGSPSTETAGRWAQVARFVGRHPRRIWIATAVVLGAFAACLPFLRADGIPQSEIFLTEVESVTGQEALARHFPAGSDSPAIVIAQQELAEDALAVAQAEPGVASAIITSQPGDPAAPPGSGDPLVVDGRVQIEATLADASDSLAAEDTVRSLRADLDEVSTDVLVGGNTAVQLDSLETSAADLTRIIPAVLIVIFIVLALLLRSLVAPLLIIAANVLSFAATLGVSALVFNYLFRFPGGDPSIVLFGFVFLVALGIDYSIFLMTRVREESIRRGTRPGILTGLSVTGGVITSAGIVLAATFASLATLPILFLAQLAFIVAFGVLLDALVVRSLLLPALGYDIGRRIWWPHRLSRAEESAPLREPERDAVGVTG